MHTSAPREIPQARDSSDKESSRWAVDHHHLDDYHDNRTLPLCQARVLDNSQNLLVGSQALFDRERYRCRTHHEFVRESVSIAAQFETRYGTPKPLARDTPSAISLKVVFRSVVHGMPVYPR
jgi:hypothetical protein